MIRELSTRYGTMFVPDTDSGQYWWLANIGASPEDHWIEMVCELLDERPKGTAVDVGANFGCWTLPLARHAHSVYAIEPQIGIVKLIQKSLTASKINNVHLFNCAAGATPGVVSIPDLDLQAASNFGGIAVDAVSQDQPGAKCSTIPVSRVDDLVRGAQVSFIKADVEGYEVRVLAGAADTIKRCKPILFVEMDHPNTNKAMLRRMIEEWGYGVEEQGGNFLALPL